MPAKKYPLEIIIGAVDRVTAPFNRLNRQLEELNRPVKKLQRSFAALNRTLGMARLSRSLSNVRRSFVRVSDGFYTMFRRATMVGAAIGGVAAGIGYFAKKAGDMEQINVAFATMLKSEAKAKSMVGALTEFAAKTPFSLMNIFAVSKKLIGMGGDAFKQEKKLLEVMRMLGDAAAGQSVPLEQVALAYGKIKAAGRLMGKEMLQFYSAGIPLLEELQKMLFGGMSNANSQRVQKLMAKGLISYDIVEKAFKRMTGKGGVYFNMMEKQAKTFLGLMSIVGDALDLLAISIGDYLLPVLKPLASQFIEFVNANRALIAAKVGKPLADLVKMIPKAIPIVRREFETMKPVLLQLGETLKVVHEKFGVFKLGLIAISAFVAGPFLLAINGLMVAIIDLIAVVMTSPLGIILVGLVAWGSAIKSVIDDWKMLKATFLEVVDVIENKLLKLTMPITRFFSSISDNAFTRWVTGDTSAPTTRIVDRATVPDGTRVASRNANVRVSFDNAPRGMRVTQEPGSQPVSLDVGYQFGFAGKVMP